MRQWLPTIGLILVAAVVYAAPPFLSYSPSSSESGTQTFTAGDRTYNGDLAVNGNLSTAALSTPTNGTFTAGSGGALTDGTSYYYRVAATTATGTTLASTETSLATTAYDGGTHGTVTVTWAQITGATGYKVYCRTTGAETLCATITSGATLSWTDDGGVSPSGALPAANTTGSASVAGQLSVTGDAGISGSCAVVGQFTAKNDAGVLNNFSVGNALTVTNNITANSIFLGGHTVGGSGGQGPMEFQGYQADSASAFATKITSAFALSTAGASITGFYSDTTTLKARVDLNGFFINPVQTLTVANDGNGGTAATATLTPTSGYINCTCNDPQGCTITMGETGAQDGTVVRIVSSTSTACNFVDTSGVSELTGAVALGQYDSLTLIYLSDRWVELAASNN